MGGIDVVLGLENRKSIRFLFLHMMTLVQNNSDHATDDCHWYPVSKEDFV